MNKCLPILLATALFLTVQPPQSDSQVLHTDTVDIARYSGAVGDGIVDDTAKVQKALTTCSNHGLTCVIPSNKRFLITKQLYLWGEGSLIGVDSTSMLLLRTGHVPYILNIGISGAQKLEQKWSGSIEHVTFRGVGPGTGRIIFLWRSEGGTISKNVFNIGAFGYGPTSSGNNNKVVRNGDGNCIRKNITITDNMIFAEGTDVIGSEGIGLNQWDGAEIARNVVHGVGDDMIGVHFSSNINIHDNDLSGVDGRLFVSNSHHVMIENNKISRVASPSTGLWYPGIALLYIGHEGDRTNKERAPTSITARGNTLIYNEGAVDRGAAIYIYSPRDVTIANNQVINNSSTVSAVGIHLLPFPFSKGVIWTDPDGLDPPTVSRVHGVTISNNNLSGGAYHLPLIETGFHCTHYSGLVKITDNTASRYSFICGPETNSNLVR